MTYKWISLTLTLKSTIYNLHLTAWLNFIQFLGGVTYTRLSVLALHCKSLSSLKREMLMYRVLRR